MLYFAYILKIYLHVSYLKNEGKVLKYNKKLLLFALTCGVSITAAPFTDTGSIYKQIKQNQIEKAEENKHPKYELKKKEHTEKHQVTAQTYYIKDFKVIGNIDLTQAQTDKALKSYKNRKLSKAQIQEAANALQAVHMKNGDLTTEVKIVPHSIHDNTVTLRVIEGVLEKNGISIQNSGDRIKSKKVLDLLNHTIKPGLMEEKDYERAILLTNDFPGISGKADIYLGEEAGTDDLVMTITDEDVFNGNIDIDNYGSYYTGRTEIGTTLYWNSPTKNGEEIVARFITTGKYSNFGYLDLAVPVFDNGMRIGASVDFLKYELDTDKSVTYGDGTVWDVRAYVKYPVIRTEDLNVETELNYTHTDIKDNSVTEEIDNTTIDKGILTISGNRSDEFLDNGITYFSASVTVGDLKLKNQKFEETDEQLYQTAGSFTKFNFSLSRLQNLVGALSSKISVDGQWANKNLDTSEKYFLGGPYSVGGYPVGTAAGDHAAVLYADLRYDFYDMPWGGDFQLSTYYTYGWTKIFDDPSALIKTYPGLEQYAGDNEVKLQSVGLGFSQTWSDTAVLRVMVGKQVGDNVLREYFDPKGKDYDRSDSDYRAWVNLIYYF